MTDLELLKSKKIPEHVAVVMDGNGRWAKQRGKPRIEGHQQGAVALRNALEACLNTGVKYLTVYAFSIENWNRSPEEVNGLMALFVKSCCTEIDNLMKNNIRFRAIGKLDLLDNECLKELRATEEKTKNNTALILNVAISYGSRWEITNAAQTIAKKVQKGELNPDTIDEQLFASYLQTAYLPDPDLLIRTSGEYRISNYLLWQLAYTEFYFTDTLWPDFTVEDFYKAIADYQKRERRFGKTSEQIITL
jgi:undecaprenyl diphosphate synthase